MRTNRWKLGGSSSDGPDYRITETAYTSSSALQVAGLYILHERVNINIFWITPSSQMHRHYQLQFPHLFSGLAGDQTTGRELLAHLATHLLHSYAKVTLALSLASFLLLPQLFSGPSFDRPAGQHPGVNPASSKPRRVHTGSQGILFGNP